MTTNRPEFKAHDDFIFEHKEIGKVTRQEFIKYIRSSHEHMRKLSKIIQQYNQTIDSYLDEWDGRFESFDDDVKDLLERWIQDGTMDNIINENLMSSKADKEYVDDLNENVTAQLAQKASQSALETEKGRISNLVAHAGNTDGNSELLDARIGYGGKSHATVGDAVRTVGGSVDKILKNDGSVRYDESDFPNTKVYNVRGTVANETGWGTWKSTELIPIKKGDSIELTVSVTTNENYPPLLMFNTQESFSGAINTTKTEEGLDTIRHSFAEDGYFIAQTENKMLEHYFTVNQGKPLFLTDSDIGDIDAFAERQEVVLLTGFEKGHVSYYGDEEESERHARSKETYRFLPGTVIKVKKTGRHQYGINTSSTPTFNGPVPYYSEEENSFTITKEKPYVRLFMRSRSDEIELNMDEAIEQITFSINSRAMYEMDVDSKIISTVDKLEKVEAKVNTMRGTSFEFNPSFRAPSLSTGGVVTFIDDDGWKEVHSDLYPFIKRLEVPYGIGIVPSWIGTDIIKVSGSTGYMSHEQLFEIEKDKKHIEIMNHTYEHYNLSGLNEEDVHYQIKESMKWFDVNGLDCKGFVLPYGGHNDMVRRVVQQYYNNCYHFSRPRVETFDTITNNLISRSDFGNQADRLQQHKNYVDQAKAQNGWLVITTHIGHPNYRNDETFADLEELVGYIRSQGLKILKPQDAFQVFGNIAENDSGFKIQANGVVVSE